VAISDKTRKILWGRSGNRCAICRNELLVDATETDDESVVGDECHVVSGRSQGPRYDSSFPSDQLDSHTNLILLCRVHHKMVDDQSETYTADLLHQIKGNHERWVSSTLGSRGELPPVRLHRPEASILLRLSSGREILNLLSNAYEFTVSNDELGTQAEVDLVGGFLQTIHDSAEIDSDMEAGERVRTAFGLSESIKELESAGFVVFGGRDVGKVDGGAGDSRPWPVAHIRVVRSTSPEIKSFDPQGIPAKPSQGGTSTEPGAEGGGDA